MKKFSKFLMLASFLIALPLAGCNEATGLDDATLKKLVSEVSLNENELIMEVGETFELTPTIVFKDEQEHSDLKIKWVTSDINVCSVDDGLVTALGGGEASVSIIAGYKMATCNVTVPTGGGSSGFTITLSETTKQIVVGEQFTLTATPSVKADIAWNTSDSSIASVDANGLVSGISVGEADIGASALGVSVSCHVSVLDAGDVFIKLNASNVDLACGEGYQLIATLKEEATVTWRSSDETLATVSSTGLVTAKEGVEGTVTISATANGVTALCLFNIVNEDDVYDCTVYFFIDYNNIDTTDTTKTKLLAKFRWYNDQPLSASGKVPANPTVAMDPAFPYFIGWSNHTIIDSKADLWKLESDVCGNAPYLYLYGIWADVPAGEFTK